MLNRQFTFIYSDLDPDGYSCFDIEPKNYRNREEYLSEVYKLNREEAKKFGLEHILVTFQNHDYELGIATTDRYLKLAADALQDASPFYWNWLGVCYLILPEISEDKIEKVLGVLIQKHFEAILAPYFSKQASYIDYIEGIISPFLCENLETVAPLTELPELSSNGGELQLILATDSGKRYRIHSGSWHQCDHQTYQRQRNLVR